MTHTLTLKWRFGLVTWFINRFLRKFERARDKCEDSIIAAEVKITELRNLKTQFTKQADVVNNFLGALKR